MQIETECSHFCISEEQRFHSSLSQIILDRDIVAEVTIVNQCNIDSLTERVGATRVRNSTTRWVTVVTDPNVGCEIVQTIVLDDVFSIADNLQNEHVSSMTQNESISPPILCVEFNVEFVCISVYIFRMDGFFILKVTWTQPTLFKHLSDSGFSRLDPVTGHRRWAHFECRQAGPIFKNRHVKDV